MPNLKQSPIGYQPFKANAVLSDGLLAIDRPGGELAAAVSRSLFGAADMFRQKAEATAVRKGEDAGRAAANAASPTVTVTGGRRQDPADDRIEAGPVTGTMADALNKSAPGDVQAALTKAAYRHGQSAKALITFARIESRFNPKARNAESGAAGLLQFMPSTAAQYGIDPYDVNQAADGGARLLRDNRDYLEKKLGRDVTIGELYLAHQQGAGGAVALLKNPGEPAWKIVGRKAVLQNGGTLEMTAGQFARLWTSKAGDDPVGAESFLGPMPEVDLDIDPIQGPRDPLSITAEGGQMPKAGRDTLFGAAFDRVAEATYVKRLEDEMLNGTAEIARTFKGDPEGMAEAFKQLRQKQLEAHVTPELAGDFNSAFSTVERRYLREAQDARETEMKRQNETRWDSESKDLQRGFDTALEQLDPANADSKDIAMANAARIKNHLRNGVARGFITSDKAKELAQKVDDGVTASWYIQQGKGKDAAAIEELRTRLEADFKAGKLEGVSGSAWREIDAGLKGQASEWVRTDAGNREQFSSLAQGVLDRAAAGYDIPADDLAALERAAAKVQNGEQLMTVTRKTLDVAKMLRDRPIGEVEARVRDLRKAAGNAPSKEDAAMIAAMEAMVVKARQALATDPLGYGERAGVIEAVPTFENVKTPEDMKAVIQARAEAGAAVAAKFGTAERFFRPGEVKMLEEMAQADPNVGARFAAAMIQGAGGKTKAMLSEFGQAAPVLAGAGAILAGGGDALAARDAIAGSGKNADGNAYSSKGWQERRKQAQEVGGVSLIFQPEDEQRVIATAERIARKRIDDAGVEPDSDEAADIHLRALNEAAGAVYDSAGQWGGFAEYDPGMWADAQKVLVPNTIRADRLADVLASVRESDLAVKPQGGVDRMRDLWPVLTAKGYVFVDFTLEGEPVPLAGEDGKPFVLDLVALTPKLAPRVSGAFRGY
jgi:hypothetical protein